MNEDAFLEAEYEDRNGYPEDFGDDHFYEDPEDEYLEPYEREHGYPD